MPTITKTDKVAIGGAATITASLYAFTAFIIPSTGTTYFLLDGVQIFDNTIVRIDPNKTYVLQAVLPSNSVFGGWNTTRGVVVKNVTSGGLTTTVTFNKTNWNGTNVGILTALYNPPPQLLKIPTTSPTQFMPQKAVGHSADVVQPITGIIHDVLSDPGVTRIGNWITITDPGSMEGSYIQSSTRGDQIVFDYVGTSVWIRFFGTPTSGKVSIYIDGNIIVSGLSFATSGATTGYFMPVFGLTVTRGQHRLVIIVDGTSVGATNDVNVDCFVTDLQSGLTQVLALSEQTVPAITTVVITPNPLPVTITPPFTPEFFGGGGPAIGQEINQVLLSAAGTQTFQLMGFSFPFLTSATPGNRTVRIKMSDGGGRILWQYGGAPAHAPSTQKLYICSTQSLTGDDGYGVHIPIPLGLLVQPGVGMFLITNTVGLDPNPNTGDAFQEINYYMIRLQ